MHQNGYIGPKFGNLNQKLVFYGFFFAIFHLQCLLFYELQQFIRARRSIHSPSPLPAAAAKKHGKSPLKHVSDDDNDNVDDEPSFDREHDSYEHRSDTSFEYSYSKLRVDLRDLTARDGGYEMLTKNKKNASLESNDSPHQHKETGHTAANAAQSSQNLIFIYIAIFGVILIGSFAMFFLWSDKEDAQKRIECPQFKELTKEFLHQDQLLWKSLKINIENVVNRTPAQPGVFLLAYNDPDTIKSVMAKILNATANCMQSRHPIQLEAATFATEAMIKDYGEIIAAYRQPLEHNGILYVADINKMPAMAAKAFHTICDTVTPLVERSVIFFTMYVDQYDRNMSPREIHNVVEHQLESNWQAINQDALKALVGRVTNQVFLLHSEKTIR